MTLSLIRIALNVTCYKAIPLGTPVRWFSPPHPRVTLKTLSHLKDQISAIIDGWNLCLEYNVLYKDHAWVHCRLWGSTISKEMKHVSDKLSVECSVYESVSEWWWHCKYFTVDLVFGSVWLVASSHRFNTSLSESNNLSTCIKKQL